MVNNVKVGIITIFDPSANYGNRLQNYAVHNTLKCMGLISETLYVEEQHLSLKDKFKKSINKITNYHFTKSKQYWENDFKKMLRFKLFNDEYVPSKKVKSFKNLSKQYNYFVVGSDQVWNPTWYDENKKKAYLLSFAKPQQRICFSPSFGVPELPGEWKEYFKNELQQIPNISVREEAGANIVKELTGKKAEVLIDPTLMLGKEQWEQIERKPNKVKFDKDYILTYFLGDKTKEQEEYIKKIGSDNNLEIYNLLDYSQPELYLTDPSEFIYLIHNAALVFTDSFHACVFSFIFQKPFQVFPRNGVENNMMSRITTLLNKFSLQRKLYGVAENDLFECDYSEGYKQLKIEQNKVNKFLEKSFA